MALTHIPINQTCSLTKGKTTMIVIKRWRGLEDLDGINTMFVFGDIDRFGD